MDSPVSSRLIKANVPESVLVSYQKLRATSFENLYMNLMVMLWNMASESIKQADFSVLQMLFSGYTAKTQFHLKDLVFTDPHKILMGVPVSIGSAKRFLRSILSILMLMGDYDEMYKNGFHTYEGSSVQSHLEKLLYGPDFLSKVFHDINQTKTALARVLNDTKPMLTAIEHGTKSFDLMALASSYITLRTLSIYATPSSGSQDHAELEEAMKSCNLTLQRTFSLGSWGDDGDRHDVDDN